MKKSAEKCECGKSHDHERLSITPPTAQVAEDYWRVIATVANEIWHRIQRRKVIHLP